jgi:hypothetical protein
MEPHTIGTKLHAQFLKYSRWWVQRAPETCRVYSRNKKAEDCIKLVVHWTNNDARIHKHQIHQLWLFIIFLIKFIKLGLVDSPRYDGCKWASETASRVLCDCTTLAEFRFGHLVHHFLKPADFTDISNSKVLHFVRSARCWMFRQRVKRKIGNGRGAWVSAAPALTHSTLLYITSRFYFVYFNLVIATCIWTNKCESNSV